MCDSNWDIKNAFVICKMLGYRGAMSAPRRALFGKSSRRALLGEVNCDGSESNVEDCEHAGWRPRNCQKRRSAAGVVCFPSKLKIITFQMPE